MARKLIGIDLGGTNLRAAVVDEEGTILGSARVETAASEGPEAVVARMAACAREAVADAGLEAQGISACGIGSPGPLDAREGKIIFMANLPGWDDFPVARRLADELGLTCFLENDANSAGWGEYWQGAGKGSTEMVIYTLGTGVGGCVVVRGKLHRGSDQNAGEIGHAVLVPDGRECGCGSRGCLEQYCSATAVARSAREALERSKGGGEETGLEHLAPGEITAKAVHEAATKGSAFCRDLLAETGRLLGIGIVTVVNIVDPQVVVIYGGMADAGDMLLEPCRKVVRELALPPAAERVKIVTSELGGDAGVVGAAGLALRRLDGEEA